MPLVPLRHLNLEEGRFVFREMYGRSLAFTLRGGKPVCFEIPPEHLASAQAGACAIDDIPGVKVHNTYTDSEVTFVNLAPPPEPIKHAAPAPMDQEMFGMGHASVPPPEGAYPTPLVPFAGCDKKAPPPSPAKPFSLTASPVKPSPMKERVDHATQAVVQKNWGARQASLKQFFGKAPAQQSISEPVARLEVLPMDY